MGIKDKTKHFTVTILHDEDLVAVLRAHMHIEQGLIELITLEIPGCELLLESFTFGSLMDMACKLKLISQETLKLLAAINKVRNSFAHELNKIALSKDDSHNMVSKLTDSAKYTYEDLVAGQKAAKLSVNAGVTARMAITAAYTEVCIRIGVMKVQKGILPLSYFDNSQSAPSAVTDAN